MIAAIAWLAFGAICLIGGAIAYFACDRDDPEKPDLFLYHWEGKEQSEDRS